MISGVRRNEGISLRQAAIIAGIAYFIAPVVYAEFKLYPALVTRNPAQTIHNIQGSGSEFGVAILCYFIEYMLDIVIAWALYVLLCPVNKALSLLTAVVRWVYAAMALFGVLQVAVAFRIITGPYASTFPPSQLQAQVQLLLDSFRYGLSFSLVVFGIHLLLLGYLVYRASDVLYRSNLIPKIIGVLVAIVGVAWVVNGLHPYLFPAVNVGWVLPVGFFELLLPLWLLIMGWRVTVPAEST